MKYPIFILCALLMVASVKPAQGQNTPQEVKEAFEANYPDITKVKWNQDNEVYEADFNYNGRSYRSVYTSDGQWVEDYTIIRDNEIPAAVKDGFTASEYRYWNIDNISRVSLPNAETVYRYHLNYEDYNKAVEFNGDGSRR